MVNLNSVQYSIVLLVHFRCTGKQQTERLYEHLEGFEGSNRSDCAAG